MTYEHRMTGRLGARLPDYQLADLDRLERKGQKKLTPEDRGRLYAYKIAGGPDESRRAADLLGVRR